MAAALTGSTPAKAPTPTEGKAKDMNKASDLVMMFLVTCSVICFPYSANLRAVPLPPALPGYVEPGSDVFVAGPPAPPVAAGVMDEVSVP